jgi:hypothetical protein
MTTTATLGAVYRPLTDEEIRDFEAAGCTAESWDQVEVAERFSFVPGAWADVTFSGRIRLGCQNAAVVLPGGLERPCGVRRATLHNCTLGHSVLIHNVGRHIANYTIGDNVVIDHVDLLATEGTSTFGNGTRAAVLNEAGGREVPIFDRLSAHLAYLLAVYRDRPELIQRLETLVARYVAGVKAPRGTIGSGAWLTSCGSLINVRVGPAAYLSGVRKLHDGTVGSSPESPTKVGDGVIAEHFIVAAGAVVDSGAILTRSFIGQGVRVGKQFSAENSLLFANCEGLHGEMCSVFAGPYTVTHHRSSLLIAGMFSFFNAGSGTNQSNHMYKLGPVHQGVLERGAKTGSDSYLLWPSRVGAFTTVIGRHGRGVDTSPFPFSYLLERGEESVLVPGANLHAVGTRRDAAKWPQRDRRTGRDRLDHIHFDALNPCTVGQMLRGRQLLRQLEATTDASTESVHVGGAVIPRVRLAKGLSAYTMAIDWYLGDRIVRRLEAVRESVAVGQWPTALVASAKKGSGVDFATRTLSDTAESGLSRNRLPTPLVDSWLDVAGLLAPAARIEELIQQVVQGHIRTPEALEIALQRLHGQYAELEWAWARETWLAEIGKTAGDVTLDDLAEAVRRWRDAAARWNAWALRDAEQEFRSTARISYGLGGDAEADFQAVRGSLQEDKFVAAWQRETAEVEARAEALLGKLAVVGS